MTQHSRHALRVVAAAMSVACAAAAAAQTPDRLQYLSMVSTMVAQQGPFNALASANIRDLYPPYVESLTLANFQQIESGLATGGLVPLPTDPRFNIRVRLDGPNPIGEVDLPHQASYVSARAAAIGCLIDVASRVKSGPVEVTSLVRHLDYQHQLLATNTNATTDIPTHTLGLAFDIAMVNSSLRTVLEIRDVLRKMSDAGDVFVIVERQQLVFHVVPQPSRLGWYADVYARAISGQSWNRVAGDRSLSGPLTPVVTTAMGSVRPLPAFAAAWWAADNAATDLPIDVSVGLGLATIPRRNLMGRYVDWVGGLLSSAWQHTLPWTVG